MTTNTRRATVGLVVMTVTVAGLSAATAGRVRSVRAARGTIQTTVTPVPSTVVARRKPVVAKLSRRATHKRPTKHKKRH